MVRKRSCPAVSHIWSFITFPPSSIVLILKSIPIVVIKVGLNESFAYRSNKHVFPTPLSPIISSLICMSKVCCWRVAIFPLSSTKLYDLMKSNFSTEEISNRIHLLSNTKLKMYKSKKGFQQKRKWCYLISLQYNFLFQQVTSLSLCIYIYMRCNGECTENI